MFNNCKVVLKNNSGFKWYNNHNIYVKGYIFDSKNRYFEKEDLIKYFNDIVSVKHFKTKVSSANGCFSVIIKIKNIFLIAVDKIRTFPLFYTFKSDQFIITDLTSTLQDINITTKLDESSVIEFRSSGFVSGKYTLLQNVYQIRSGEMLIITQSNIINDIYYHYSITESNNLSFIENHTKLLQVFDESFKRLIISLKGRTAVIPLSGGYDSRLIAVLLKKLQVKNVVCYTYGTRNNREIKISKDVANKLNYKWHFIEYNNVLLEDFLVDNFFYNYCSYNTNHTSMLFLQEYFAVKYLKEKKMIPDDAIFLPGHSGDFLGGSQLIKNGILQKNISFEKMMLTILKKKYNIVTPKKNCDKIIIDRIKQSYITNNKYSKNVLSYSAFEDWDFKEKLAKVIFNSSNVYSYFGYEYRFPFWDNAIVEFFKYLPYEQKLLKKLYDYTLKNYYFEKFKLNFNAELQASLMQIYLQKIKDFLKHYIPAPIKKEINLNNDYYGGRFITEQITKDLKKYKVKPVWGYNINSIQIQWFLEKLIFSLDDNNLN